MGRKILAIIGSGFAFSFSADWGTMFKTKHNLYKVGDREIPVYRYDRTDFYIFCFSCHVRATPHVDNVERFSTYAYGVDEVKKKNVYPQSLVCLSCHDGFIAPNISPTSRTHHPFFITYREEKFVLRPPDTSLKGWVGAQKISDLVVRFKGTLQCVSCHDPHLSIPNFLRRSNEGSALCLGCHEK